MCAESLQLCPLVTHTCTQDGTETRKTFFHVPSAIEAEEAEEIGVEHLLRDIKDSTTTTLATRVEEQLASLRGLQARLTDIQKYLVDISTGKMPLNHQIVYHLQDALNLLPDLSDPTTTQSFVSSTNDELLVVYLSSLLRAVIALHALVDNKATIGRVELEESGSEEKRVLKGDAKKEKEEYDKRYQATLREVADKQKEARNSAKSHAFSGRTGLTAAGIAERDRELARQAEREKQKERERKDLDALGRRHLANMRVVQRNVVYVVGLGQRFAKEEVSIASIALGKDLTVPSSSSRLYGHTSISDSMARYPRSSCTSALLPALRIPYWASTSPTIDRKTQLGRSRRLMAHPLRVAMAK